MLILAGIWLCYVVYKTIRLFVDLCKHRNITFLRVLDLLCDLCMGIIFLLEGLALQDIIQIDSVVFILALPLYPLGKFIAQKK